MRACFWKRWGLGLVAAVVVAAWPMAAAAAVGHGSTAAGLAKLAASVGERAKVPLAPGHAEPGFMASVQGEVAGWSGGILALEGFRRLAAPLTAALGSGLGSFLPPGIARTAAGVVTELVSGAAFKVGMDAGQDLLTTGTVKKPDWLEVGGAAIGMVAGGMLGKPLGPIGEAIGSWLGWSLGENLAKNYRAGKGFSITQAFADIDVGRLVLQAVTAEGAALIAGPLVTTLFGLTGTAGTIASIAVQIGLSAGATVIARKIGDELFGPEKEADGSAAKDGAQGAEARPAADAPPAAGDLPALEKAAQDAYRRFVVASRSTGTGQAGLTRALADYRAAQQRLATARSASN